MITLRDLILRRKSTRREKLRIALWCVSMTKVIEIRGCRIGEGMPKICVPVTGRTEGEIFRQIKDVVAASPDLVEWRADFFERVQEREQVHTLFAELRNYLGECHSYLRNVPGKKAALWQ